MFSKRKGFTLVELLIVIIVIGILAGGMMLAAGGMTETAEGSNIVSGLRNAKAAGITFHANNQTLTVSALTNSWNTASMMPIMLQLMDNKTAATQLTYTVDADYTYVTAAQNNGGDPITGVAYFIGMVPKTEEIANKAGGQAKGALFNQDFTPMDGSNANGTLPIYMLVK